jgi:hypothetical protein
MLKGDGEMRTNKLRELKTIAAQIFSDRSRASTVAEPSRTLQLIKRMRVRLAAWQSQNLPPPHLGPKANGEMKQRRRTDLTRHWPGWV